MATSFLTEIMRFQVISAGFQVVSSGFQWFPGGFQRNLTIIFIINVLLSHRPGGRGCHCVAAACGGGVAAVCDSVATAYIGGIGEIRIVPRQ